MCNIDDLQFIDFCSGIGAGRLGLEKLGLNCLGFSEIDEKAEMTYRLFFGEEEKNFGDLMKINPIKLPSFDLMIAGFPCQSFSINGQRKGMNDERGQIIFGLIRIMKAKKLKYFILENVKGLVNHEGGQSLKIILAELDKAGYKVFSKVLNSRDHGVPQMRERIYFVGIRRDLINIDQEFIWPKAKKIPKIAKYLIDEDNLEFKVGDKLYNTFSRYLNNRYNKDKYLEKEILSKELLVIDTRQSDLRLYEGQIPTLRTGRHGLMYVRSNSFRKLSGFEALLLQGFPKRMAKKTKGKISDSNLLSQAGNAMTVSTIEVLGQKLLDYITKQNKYVSNKTKGSRL